MTETKPKRRWFRFSLRTLFVLVLIASIPAWWWSHQLIWVVDRHRFLETLTTASNGERLFFGRNEVRSRWHWVPSVPLVRRIFDEPSYGLLILPLEYGSDQIDKAACLFPEATIIKINGYLNINGRKLPNTIDVTKLDN